MLAHIWNSTLKDKSKLHYERYWAGTNEALGLSAFYDQALEQKENIFSYHWLLSYLCMLVILGPTAHCCILLERNLVTNDLLNIQTRQLSHEQKLFQWFVHFLDDRDQGRML